MSMSPRPPLFAALLRVLAMKDQVISWLWRVQLLMLHEHMPLLKVLRKQCSLYIGHPGISVSSACSEGSCQQAGKADAKENLSYFDQHLVSTLAVLPNLSLPVSCLSAACHVAAPDKPHDSETTASFYSHGCECCCTQLSLRTCHCFDSTFLAGTMLCISGMPQADHSLAVRREVNVQESTKASRLQGCDSLRPGLPTCCTDAVPPAGSAVSSQLQTHLPPPAACPGSPCPESSTPQPCQADTVKTLDPASAPHTRTVAAHSERVEPALQCTYRATWVAC